VSADYCADLRQSCAGGRSGRELRIAAVVCIIKSQRCDRKIVVAPLVVAALPLLILLS
jgi:hypothetical protein